MRRIRATSLGAAAALVLALAGCGQSAHDAVQSKVQQFVQATAAHDYRTLCTEVLGPALLARLRAGGVPCEQAMSIALGRVHAPILSVGRITVDGDRAQAITLSGAAGQRGAFETIGLVNTSNGWRISSLATPSVR
ncbi:MAG TPA: hypothetical protein VG410_08390 [Solirubrobacteraceae bacterium]|jgi:hypothetical protein|nr:hypothetical protein [Solirubrobacteraceae bacterium]